MKAAEDRSVLGIEVTRETVLKVLDRLEHKILAEVHNVARSDGVPRTRGAFSLWVDVKEEELAVIDYLRARVGGGK